MMDRYERVGVWSFVSGGIVVGIFGMIWTARSDAALKECVHGAALCTDREQEIVAERNKLGHQLMQDERELNDCRIDLHACQNHSKEQKEIVDVCVDRAIQRIGERRGTAMP